MKNKGKMQKLGKFIVFEGIDGCGKGTQLKLTASWLFSLNKEYDVFSTREPTRDFKELREKMSMGKNAEDDVEWYVKMFVMDRKNHVDKYIQPNLKNGTHVLSDRYSHSTLAYQQTQGISFDRLLKMHKGLLVPDLTLIFDCSAEIAFERRKKEGATDVFDKDLDFQKKLRQNYLELKSLLVYENIVIIDSTKSVEKIFENVKKEIKKIL